MQYNKVILVGMTKNVKGSTDGVRNTLSFTLTQGEKTKDGKWTNRFYPVYVSARALEHVQSWLVEGKNVLVEGKLVCNSYKNEDGTWKNSTFITGDLIKEVTVTTFTEKQETTKFRTKPHTEYTTQGDTGADMGTVEETF